MWLCGHRMLVKVAIQLWLLPAFSILAASHAGSFQIYSAIILIEIHLLSNLIRNEIVQGILGSSSSRVYTLIKVLLSLATMARRTDHSAMLLL